MNKSRALNDYQIRAADTAVYPYAGNMTQQPLNYAILGLVGEAGELANTWKKVLRQGTLKTFEYRNPHIREQLMNELGDVLWYVAATARELGYSLDNVATANLEKLRRRVKNGTLETR